MNVAQQQTPDQPPRNANMSVAGGSIGPNSIIQLREAVRDFQGDVAAMTLFRQAGLSQWFDTPSQGMVPEAVPAALFATLYNHYPVPLAHDIAAEAGRLTADYVLAHRIPGPVKALLSVLPPNGAARMLLRAIERNSWTFAGSGTCRVQTAPPYSIYIDENPMAMPDCVWHQAVFCRLFEALVTPSVRIRHRTCCLEGAPSCRFDIGV